MKKLALIAILVIISLSASALEVIKEGKKTTLIFKNQKEMKQNFSFEKARKSGHEVVSVAAQNGKIVVIVKRKF